LNELWHKNRNNAGYLEQPEANITDSEPDEWWKSVAINLKGPYLIGRSFILHLVRKQSGLRTICNVTSIGAHMILPGMSAYNIAKLALCRLTEYEDGEYGSQSQSQSQGGGGVIAFCLNPGGVDTDMGRRLPEEKQVYLTDTPQLPADTTVWLTRERREWLAGRYVTVNWDMEQLEGWAGQIVEKDLLKAKLDIGDLPLGTSR
jgi:NAD(P)-dependent dehydrogenase (short-subunit alcohol dehydrogenase family)